MGLGALWGALGRAWVAGAPSPTGAALRRQDWHLGKSPQPWAKLPSVFLPRWVQQARRLCPPAHSQHGEGAGPLAASGRNHSDKGWGEGRVGLAPGAQSPAGPPGHCTWGMAGRGVGCTAQDLFLMCALTIKPGSPGPAISCVPGLCVSPGSTKDRGWHPSEQPVATYLVRHWPGPP